MQHSYADVNGVRLHYVSDGAGPLMMFLHGFPEFWYEWRSQLQEFARDFFVVAPDMRGYNLSSKPLAVSDYAVPKLVEDIRALAEHLGHKKFILVGHDWGGAVAWAFAAKHPGHLEKLVISNAPHPGIFTRLLREDRAQRRASRYIRDFRRFPVEKVLPLFNYALLKFAFRRTGLADGAFSREDWQQYEKAWSQPGALKAALNYYRALPIDLIADNREIDIHVPTLVVWGEKDPALTIANLELLPAHVPDLTVKRFPTASHWLIHEQAGAVNEAIREFVGRAGAASVA